MMKSLGSHSRLSMCCSSASVQNGDREILCRNYTAGNAAPAGDGERAYRIWPKMVANNHCPDNNNNNNNFLNSMAACVAQIMARHPLGLSHRVDGAAARPRHSACLARVSPTSRASNPLTCTRAAHYALFLSALLKHVDSPARTSHGHTQLETAAAASAERVDGMKQAWRTSRTVACCTCLASASCEFECCLATARVQAQRAKHIAQSLSVLAWCSFHRPRARAHVFCARRVCCDERDEEMSIRIGASHTDARVED